jgi:hypothetical protein
MSLHPDTFQYLKPTPEQADLMRQLRDATTRYAAMVDQLLPDGPDKTYILRKLRETAMWVNVAITRHPDGSPRHDAREKWEQREPDYPAEHPAPGDLGSVPL